MSPGTGFKIMHIRLSERVSGRHVLLSVSRLIEKDTGTFAGDQCVRQKATADGVF